MNEEDRCGMNMKDISHANLLLYASDSTWHSCCKYLNEYGRLGHNNKSRLPDFDENENYYAEILSRLNEADVLRKENGELRNALIDARSWMDAGMVEDVPPQYTAMVANVDAMLSKESEASHE